MSDSFTKFTATKIGYFILVCKLAIDRYFCIDFSKSSNGITVFTP
jgi:hypothetical protein